MTANKELFKSAAILAAIISGKEYSVGVSGDSISVIEVFDKHYDCLDHYSREKPPREPFRITQTLPDVKYDV